MSTQSTGPRSDEGKERSAQNATKHGLRSDRPVITGEDAAEWDAFRDDIVKGYRPASVFENELAVRIALQMWRLRRVTRFETQVINDSMDAAGRHTAYTITGIYADPKAQTVKLAFEEEQEYRDELALVPAAQNALGELHNLPPDTAIEADVARLLLNLFREDEGPEPRPITAGALRRDLVALVQKPLAQALRLAAERLETRRQELEADLAAASRRLEFLTLETARQGDALRHERVLPLDEALKRVQRYESHVSRQLDQALKMLEKIQTARRALEVEELRSEVRETMSKVGTDGSGGKTPVEAVRELMLEAIARRIQLPPAAAGESSTMKPWGSQATMKPWGSQAPAPLFSGVLSPARRPRTPSPGLRGVRAVGRRQNASGRTGTAGASLPVRFGPTPPGCTRLFDLRHAL